MAMSKGEVNRTLNVDEEEEDDDEDLSEFGYGDDGNKMKKGKKRSGSKSGQVACNCQVESCTIDMSDAKKYHKRHKVCQFHAKAAAVHLNGVHQRFCQQCSRFHEVSEFDDTKRSCRRRLAGHNERRRKSSVDQYQGEGSSN
ncbi:hypothetical protein ACFE04_020551 [Oxalis oulophora]